MLLGDQHQYCSRVGGRVVRAVCVVGLIAAAIGTAGVKTTSASVVDPVDPSRGTNQIIVRLREDVAGKLSGGQQRAAIESVAARTGRVLEYRRDHGDGVHTLRLSRRQSYGQVEAIAAELAADPRVSYAEPDVMLRHALIPNDPMYGEQWNYMAVDSNNYGVDLPTAWEIERGDPGIVIAVIDTGYRPHVDLAGRFVQGYDFIDDVLTANDGDGRDADAQDPGDWVSSEENAAGYFQGCGVSRSSWHGTHVAGTIGAASNNAWGVTGVNWHSKILPVRVLGKCGGYSSDIIDGMRWAAGLGVPGVPENAHPVRVINFSLGGPGVCSTSLQNSIDVITAQGVAVVVAAGNEGTDAAQTQPGNCRGVITVGASTRLGGLAGYSNYGVLLEISAPGGNGGAAILSTANAGQTSPTADSYVARSGTSMATPHVAGIVSLLLSIDPCLRPLQITELLQNTATEFPLSTTCLPSMCGAGIVNAGAAVAAARAGLAVRRTASITVRPKTDRPAALFSITVPSVFNSWSTSICYSP